MSTQNITKNQRQSSDDQVTIPLSALRCISKYPKDGKVLCEINTVKLEEFNQADTLETMISEARLDYILGNYTTHTTAESLITELEKDD